MNRIPILRFEPKFRRYVWGGRRLETVLGKPLGEGDNYAESWEIVDHGDDQSIVADGPFAQWSLGKLCQEFPQEMLGRDTPTPFPLLFKYLDAHQNLSVQVHPNDAAAAKLDPPDRGKTEAWVIVHADPEAKVYAGLKAGVDREAFARELERNNAVACLHAFTPRVGDCIFVPAGVVHALGAGLVVAEIQQASDTTFRLYDWDRVDKDGKPRPLHIEQGLAVLDDRAGPIHPVVPQQGSEPYIERLVACDYFVLERWTLDKPVPLDKGGRVLIVSVLEGSVDLTEQHSNATLKLGETALVPACVSAHAQPQGRATLLVMTLPEN